LKDSRLRLLLFRLLLFRFFYFSLFDIQNRFPDQRVAPAALKCMLASVRRDYRAMINNAFPGFRFLSERVQCRFVLLAVGEESVKSIDDIHPVTYAFAAAQDARYVSVRVGQRVGQSKKLEGAAVSVATVAGHCYFQKASYFAF
jgi:hypothetical protein